MTKPSRLREIEAERQREVQDFLAAHPEFSEGAFRARMRERRQVGDSQLDTVPVDPHELSEDRRAGTLVMAAQPSTRTDWQDPAVLAALEQLRPDWAELLTKRYAQGMSADDIARDEQVSRAAVLKRISKAKAKFQKVYEG